MRSAPADPLAEKPTETLQALCPLLAPREPGPMLRPELPEASPQACVGLQVKSSLAGRGHLGIGRNGDGQAGTCGFKRLHQAIERGRVIELKRSVVSHEIALKYPVAPRNITNGPNRLSLLNNNLFVV
jgi:hypothetical protein